jgi:hypothetical protein
MSQLGRLGSDYCALDRLCLIATKKDPWSHAQEIVSHYSKPNSFLEQIGLARERNRSI